MNLLQFLLTLNLTTIVFTLQNPTYYDLKTSRPLRIVINTGLGGRSHAKGMFEIGEILSKRGHLVIYAAMDDNKEYLRGYNISWHSLGPKIVDDAVFRKVITEHMGNEKYSVNQVKLASESMAMGLITLYKKSYDPFKDYLLESRPDLVVCDWAAIHCADLVKELRIPSINGFQSTDGSGATFNPSITLGFEYGPINVNGMNFFQRFYLMVIRPLIDISHLYKVVKEINILRDEYSLPKRSSFLPDMSYSLNIANTFPGFEPSVPLDPNIIQVGPILSNNNQELSPELEAFLNIHNKTAYIAFGSNAILPTSVSKSVLEGILKALDQGIIDSAIWGLGKTSESDLPSMITNASGQSVSIKEIINFHPNIKLLSWVQQTKILEHPSTKIMIGHGGLESVFETMAASKPMLIISLFGDQMRNARKVEEANVGLYVNRFTMTSDSLVNQMKEILEDKDQKYYHGLLKMRTMIQFNSNRKESTGNLFEQHAYLAMSCRQYQPYDPIKGLPPCELSHLVPVSRQMNFIHANGIDVYGFFLVLILIISLSFIYLLVKIIQFKLNQFVLLKNKEKMN